MAQRVNSPDGLEWTVRIHRFRLPPWRQSDFDLEDYGGLELILFYVVVAPIMWFIVPLLVAVVETPFWVVRSVFSKEREVSAVCTWPTAIRIVWLTRSEHADQARQHVAQELAAGHKGFTPPNAVLLTR